MSANPKPVPIGGEARHHVITLVYNLKTHDVEFPDLPSSININDTVEFTSPNGIAEVKFLSPIGEPSLVMKTGDVKALTVGGIYQFNCSVNGMEGKYGSGLEVFPPR